MSKRSVKPTERRLNTPTPILGNLPPVGKPSPKASKAAPAPAPLPATTQLVVDLPAPTLDDATRKALKPAITGALAITAIDTEAQCVQLGERRVGLERLRRLIEAIYAKADKGYIKAKQALDAQRKEQAADCLALTTPITKAVAHLDLVVDTYRDALALAAEERRAQLQAIADEQERQRALTEAAEFRQEAKAADPEVAAVFLDHAQALESLASGRAGTGMPPPLSAPPVQVAAAPAPSLGEGTYDRTDWHAELQPGALTGILQWLAADCDIVANPGLTPAVVLAHVAMRQRIQVAILPVLNGLAEKAIHPVGPPVTHAIGVVPGVLAVPVTTRVSR